MNNCGIYIIKNKINNKIYVGQSTKLNKRYRYHVNLLKKKDKHYNPHLQNSFNKYGEHSFEYIILEYVDEHNNLLEREQYWYDYYLDNGYELYNIDPPIKSCYGKRQPKHSSKTKEYFSNLYNEKIVQIDIVSGKFIKIWEGIKNTSLALGYSKNTISNCINKKTKTSCGYIWVKLSDYDPKHDYTQNLNDTIKAVYKIDKVTQEIIETYNSIAQASKENNINQSHIGAVCRGQRKTAGGYKWEYL